MDLLAELQHLEEIIPYRIQFARRASLSIRVGLDQAVSVRAPKHVPMSTIETFVRQRADWVLTKRAEFALLNRPGAETYRPGDAISYLGQRYQLEVLPGSDAPRVQVYQDKLQLRVVGLHPPADLSKIVLKWYREQALGLFAERMRHLYATMQHLGIPAFKSLKVRQMKSRWGSCRLRGDITLNLMLIKLPLDLIDYVIVHELCHLKEFNHGPGFYALMTAAMPDWAPKRAQLKSFVL